MSLVDVVLIVLALAVRAVRVPAGPARLGHLDRSASSAVRCSGRSCPVRWPTGSTAPASRGCSPRWSSCWPARCSARSWPARSAGPCAARSPGSRPRCVDSVAGAVVSAAAVLLVAWMVASPLATSPFPQVASQVRQSALVQAVDDAVPDGVRSVYDSLREAIDRRGLPDVLDPLTPTQVRDVPAPDPALRGQPGRRPRCRARWSRSAAIAPSLLAADRRLRLRLRPGAGDDQRARARRRHRARRSSAEGEEYDATPVYVDEEIDIAVLAVPGLPQVPLLLRAPSRPTPATTRSSWATPAAATSSSGPARVRDRGRDQRAGLPQHRHRRPRRLRAVRQRAGRQLRRPAVRPRRHACSAWCSPRRSTTRTPATRSPARQVADGRATAGSARPRATVDTGPCE